MALSGGCFCAWVKERLARSFTGGGLRAHEWCNKVLSGTRFSLGSVACAIRHHFGTRRRGAWRLKTHEVVVCSIARRFPGRRVPARIDGGYAPATGSSRAGALLDSPERHGLATAMDQHAITGAVQSAIKMAIIPLYTTDPNKPNAPRDQITDLHAQKIKAVCSLPAGVVNIVNDPDR